MEALMKDIPCFIINLKKDIQKKQQMQKVCNQNNIKATFIEAIYGKELTKEYIESVADQAQAKSMLGRELTVGEIGVALSQLSIYRKMLNENIEVSLILEDDVDFSINPVELQNIISKLPQDWECIMLGHHTKRSREIDTLASVWNQKEILEGHKLVRFAESPVGAYGYLINLSGARKMLDEYKVIYKPIDAWNDKILNIYGVSPSIIHVDETFMNDSLLLQERSNVVQNRTTYQSVKDKIQMILKKFHLLEVFFLIKGFFKQFRILPKYIGEK